MPPLPPPEGPDPAPDIGPGPAGTGNRLIQYLPASERSLLVDALTRVPLVRHQALHVQGEQVSALVFPEGGAMVSLLVEDGEGRRAATAAVGSEGVIGAAAAIGSGRSHATALVTMAGSGLRITAAELMTTLKRAPVLRGVLQRHSEWLLAQAMQIACCNAVHSAEQRLCRNLLQALDRQQDGNPLPLTHDMVGDALGLQRTTVTTLALRLQARGLVRYGRGRVQVLDRDGLQASACDCHGRLRKLAAELLPG